MEQLAIKEKSEEQLKKEQEDLKNKLVKAERQQVYEENNRKREEDGMDLYSNKQFLRVRKIVEGRFNH